MKKTLEKFILWINNFFTIIFNFKDFRKAKSYERKLRKGLLNRELEKILLLKEASILIPRKTKKGLSKFIPLHYKTNIEIKALILFEFGYKMKALGIKLTDDLKFI